MSKSVIKAYNDMGVDWLEVVIPPLNDDEAPYTLRAHFNFLLSNWNCIYGSGCSGLFGVQDSQYNDDAGCCVDSFYFSDRKEVGFVMEMMERLTDEDWDQELRQHVEKHGFVRVINNSDDDEKWTAKGRVYENACVFANRNGGSAGKPGCAFVHMGQRTGEKSHVDVMPNVCWQLPLRLRELDDGARYELVPWDIHEWSPNDTLEYDDNRYFASWWCIDSPDAYTGTNPVYKAMEAELRKTLGDREYDILVKAIEARLELGTVIPKMPGAVMNDGRPLLPLLIGNREPRREPSYYPEHLKQIKN